MSSVIAAAVLKVIRIVHLTCNLIICNLVICNAAPIVFTLVSKIRNEIRERGVLSRFGEQAYYKIVGGAIFVANGSNWHLCQFHLRQWVA